MKAVLAKLDGSGGDDIGAMLKTVGMTLVSTVGGAAAARSTGRCSSRWASRPPARASSRRTTGPLRSTQRSRASRCEGKAEPGDKTMLDALIPARDSFSAAVAEGASFEEALTRSAKAAEEGMLATIPLVARKGRASYLGERSAGHQDPGATSSQLLVKTAAETWAARMTIR